MHAWRQTVDSTQPAWFRCHVGGKAGCGVADTCHRLGPPLSLHRDGGEPPGVKDQKLT